MESLKSICEKKSVAKDISYSKYWEKRKNLERDFPIHQLSHNFTRKIKILKFILKEFFSMGSRDIVDISIFLH